MSRDEGREEAEPEQRRLLLAERKAFLMSTGPIENLRIALTAYKTRYCPWALGGSPNDFLSFGKK